MKLLFLCVANSARSQMAEGLAKNMLGPEHSIQSAGSYPCYVHPLAIRAMEDIGIDISNQRSKSVREIDPSTVDTVITLCADEVCPPFFGHAKKIHWPLGDPSAAGQDEEQRFIGFCKTRDQIKKLIEKNFPAYLESAGGE